MFMMLCTALGMQGITITPYVEDFSTLSVNKPDMGLKGWTRIKDVHSINGTDYSVSYQAYTYSYGAKSPSVYCSTQQVGPYGNKVDANDILVTPKITGTLSFWCKKYTTNSGSLKLFKCTKNADGSFAVGEEIDLGEEVTYTAKTITLPQEFDGEFVGFRIEGVYLDDVKATSAERDAVQSFAISSASRDGSGNLEADARNSVKLPVKITLTNTGDIDYVAGQEGYELYLHAGSSSTASSASKISTVKLTEDLPAGETKEMSVTFSFSGQGTGYFFVYDPAGNYKSLSYITVKEYKPELKIVRNQTDAYRFIPLDFGYSTEAERVLTLELQNAGSAPLNNLSCQASEGFETDCPTSIPAGESVTVNVKLTAIDPGWYTGALVFTGNNTESQTIEVRGLVSDPELWSEGFEGETLPANFLAGEYWEISKDPAVIATPGNSSWATNTGKYSYNVTELISPKLEVREGDEPLQIFAGRKGGRTDTYSELKVKYSSDREHWTELEHWQDSYSNSIFGDEMLSSDNANLFKRFTVDLPEGEWFVAFEGKYVNIAHLTGYRLAVVDHDLKHVSHSIPKEGMVNNEYVATLKLKNMNSVPETDYTVTLYAGDEVLATADAEEFAAASEKEHKMSYYPHQAGTVTMKAVFKAGDFVLETDEVDVNISEEVARINKQIGTRKSNDYYAPINAYYKHGHTETIYTEEMLGLEPGAQIVSLTYVGYRDNKTGTADVNYSAYLASDDRDKPTAAKGGFRDLNEMTLVKSGSVHFDAGQSYEGSLSDAYYTPLFEVVFDEPYTYEGGNLCVAFKSDADPTRNGVLFSLADGTYGAMIYGRDDSVENPDYYSSSYAPVVLIGTQKPTATVSGTVTANEQPVENAVVRFRSGNVHYEATSDADGKYSVEIIQIDKNYKVTASADDLAYEEEEERIFPEGPSTVNISFAAALPAVTVTGVVTDSTNDMPVANASVTFTCGERAEDPAVTDADGKYTIRIENPGDEEWTVTVTAPGYNMHSETDHLYPDEQTFDFALDPITDGILSADATAGLKVLVEGKLLVVESEDACVVNVVTPDGRVVFNSHVNPGRTELIELNSGIYIVAGHKLMVK